EQQMQLQDSVYVVQLSSTFPSYPSPVRFERRVNGGAWQSVGTVDVLPVGQCRVDYHSVDATGNVSAIASFDVWVPRGPSFVATGMPASVRSEAQYCLPAPMQ